MSVQSNIRAAHTAKSYIIGDQKFSASLAEENIGDQGLHPPLPAWSY
jgi:hypothetical protein